MTMIIRPFRSADAEALAVLLEGMQAHYRAPCPERGAILDDLSTLPPGVRVLLCDTGAVVGFAAFAAIWPGPGLRRGLFLKELYVAASARRQGVGSALLRALARLAVEEGFGRVDWTADRNDRGLQAFYERAGAALSDPHFFRLTGRALEELGRQGAD